MLHTIPTYYRQHAGPGDNASYAILLKQGAGGPRGAFGHLVNKRGEMELANEVVIAVVDDDASVRGALSRFLKSLGYHAMAFERAEEFLASNQRGNAACLIADVQMPGMTGPELHAKLVASGEPIPTIFITAYPDPSARARVAKRGNLLFAQAVPRPRFA